LRLFLAALVGAAILAGPGVVPASATAGDESPTVVLVLVRDLYWGNAPDALNGFAAANLSVRSAHARGTAEDGYLSVGKGAPSSAPKGLGVGRVATAPAGGPATTPPGSMTLLDWQVLQRHDGTLHQRGELGTLGFALEQSQRPWALVAGDPAAAAAAADRSGVVPRAFQGAGSAVTEALAEGARSLVVGTSVSDLPSVLAATGPACVLVASVSTPNRGRHLGVLAASPACGLGEAGLKSSSIRQPHLATLQDVAPTYLALLRAPRPPGVSGAPVVSAPAVSRGALEDRDERASVADGVRSPLVWLLVALSAVGVAVSLCSPRSRTAVAYAVLAIPSASFLIMLFPWWRWGFLGAVLTGAVIATALGLGAAFVGRRDVRLGVFGLALAIAAVVGIDALFGGRLEIDAPFGNSPIVGARFFGVGNIGSGFLAAGALLASGLALELWGARARVGVALGLAAAVLVGGAPWFGADVGGLMAFVPAYAVLLLGWRDGRPSVRRLLAALVVTGVVLAFFAFVDAVRPGESQSHLARALGRGGGLEDLVRRKGQRALATYKSPMAALIPIGLVALVVSRPRLRGRPALLATAWALAIAGVAGSLLNDSGLVVGAAVMAITWPAFMALAATRGRPAEGLEQPPAPALAGAGTGGAGG
jgi:hypothetical protein